MTTTHIPAAYRIIAQDILTAAREGGTQWLESGKVYLATIPGVDLADAECVTMLEDLRRCGALRFARADLVGAMDAELIAASEWHTGPATYHFLVLA